MYNGPPIQIPTRGIWITDPKIRTTDPFVKASHASRRQEELQPSTRSRAGRCHRAWCRCVHARYRPPGRRRVGHAASSLPDARSLVRSVALYETGRTDAEGRRTRNGEFTRRSARLLVSRSGGIHSWLWRCCRLDGERHADPDSALYATCEAVHSAGARLLLHAQAEGTARADMDGGDLFALVSALAWLVGQPGFAPRADHLFHIMTSAILTKKQRAE